MLAGRLKTYYLTASGTKTENKSSDENACLNNELQKKTFEKPNWLNNKYKRAQSWREKVYWHLSFQAQNWARK